MRARVAYISSLGTTAILVAAALMLLAVVSAIVAFRGWPGSATGGAGVQSVPLAPHGAAERTALVRRSPKARGVERAGPSRAVRAARTHKAVSTAGLVKEKSPRVVPGVVMEPVAVAPMQPGGSGRSSSQPTDHTLSTADPAPQRPLPDQPNGPVGSGGVTIPVPVPGPIPDPTAPPPPDGPVATMVGTLLSGGAPPPPLLDDVLAVIR